MQYVPLGDESDGMKGHGTHVVGTAIGRRAINGLSESTGEADGIARAAKVSFVDLGVTGKPRSKLCSCRLCPFLSSFKPALFYKGQITLRVPSRPSSLLKYGMEAGARIHSSSWGVEYNGYSFFERDLDNYLFENPDILLVLAAGNSGDRPNSVGSPATCKNGLTGKIDVVHRYLPSQIPISSHSFVTVKLVLAKMHYRIPGRACSGKNTLRGFQAVDLLMMDDLNRTSLPLVTIFNLPNQGPK